MFLVLWKMGAGSFIAWPFAVAFGGAIMIVVIAVLAFWIWMIVDVARRKFKEKTEKIVWILVVVLLGWLGALVYFIVVRTYNKKGIA